MLLGRERSLCDCQRSVGTSLVFALLLNILRAIRVDKAITISNRLLDLQSAFVN